MLELAVPAHPDHRAAKAKRAVRPMAGSSGSRHRRALSSPRGAVATSDLSDVAIFVLRTTLATVAASAKRSAVRKGRPLIAANYLIVATPSRQPRPTRTRATPLHQDNVMPAAFDMAEAFAIADFAESATPMQRPARLVGSQNLGLQGSNSLPPRRPRSTVRSGRFRSLYTARCL